MKLVMWALSTFFFFILSLLVYSRETVKLFDLPQGFIIEQNVIVYTVVDIYVCLPDLSVEGRGVTANRFL